MPSIPFKFVLVDCNNFFVSCERVFNPALEKRPVVVLSNNDGCVISRSQEAKKLGIKMGAPLFEIAAFCKRNQVAVYSSNFSLYGNLSQRVMAVLTQMAPEIEIYSIDEAFLKFTGEEELIPYCKKVRSLIDQWTGIPTSIGIAPTKTLAKVAGDIAKKSREGVYELSSIRDQETVLKQLPVEEIWGVGRGLKTQLNAIQIYTAWELRAADPTLIRKKLGVVGERIMRELQGVSCLPLNVAQPKQSITHSRSFGKAITELEELSEALATYINGACIKLRQQGSCIQHCAIFLESVVTAGSRFRETASATVTLPYLTNDTALIIKMAKQELQRIYRVGERYKKCGVTLLNLMPEAFLSQNLFISPAETKKTQQRLEVVDVINDRFGKNSLFYGAMGTNQLWSGRSNNCSSHFTSSWDQLAFVNAGFHF